MKISDMSRNKLLEEIQATERKVNSPAWVRNNRRWWVGVMVNHLAKLREELARRQGG
tara:strand:+ start:525 stop:695 length:171 start_codon:yes stop_codon:yes gene_type:complete